MDMKLTLAVCLPVLLAHLAQGAPSFSERRVSRDLDKIDGLRARLLRLQEQIRDLEENKKSKGREGEKNDVSAEVDVSRLQRPSSEDRMASPRQREVQNLAQGLGVQHKDLHDLAGALSQLMNEASNDSPQYNRENSAGEYLGDGYNEKYEKEDGDESEEEDDERRLRMIYNMLLQLYRDQNEQDIRVNTRGSPTEYVAASRRQEPVHIDEGSFGDFVDEDASQSNHLSSLVDASADKIRKEVLNAVEAKLLKDLELSRHAGLSVDDIIHDLQKKGEEEKQRELRTIEQQLDELQRLRSQ